MPFSHFKMIESFDWTNQVGDIQSRYQAPILNAIFFQPGRFGGNSFASDSKWQLMFPRVGTDLGPWGPDITFGFAWFNFGVIPGNQPFFHLFHGPQNAGGHSPFFLVLNNAAQIEFHNDSGTLLATCPQVLLANTWYYVETTVHIDSVAGTASMQIDGALQFAITGVNTQGGAPDNLYDSLFAFITGFDEVAIDDVYVKDTLGFLGERRVILCPPVSDGAPLNWTPSTGITHFNLVNEVPPDGDTSYVSSSTPGDIDTYGMLALPYAPAIIDAVQMSVYVRKDDAGTREVSVIVNGVTSSIVIVVTST
jgi:hypothetical protein